MFFVAKGVLALIFEFNAIKICVAMSTGDQDQKEAVSRAFKENSRGTAFRVMAFLLTKKGGVIAIKTVETYRFEPDSIFPCKKDHLKRVFMLGLEDDLACRNFSFLTALPVLDPFLRQIEPKICRQRETSSDKCSENRDLAIIDLSELPAPLPSNTYRFSALLWKTGLVDNQCAVKGFL